MYIGNKAESIPIVYWVTPYSIFFDAIGMFLPLLQSQWYLCNAICNKYEIITVEGICIQCSIYKIWIAI